MPTNPILPEAELTEIIRERIEGGQLPCVRPEGIYGGYGADELCDACTRPIDRTKIAYEVAASRAAPSPLSFHFACYVIWQRECTSRRAAA